MADSYHMEHFTQINNEFIFNIYGSGRGEYRKLISESSSPWSYSLGGLCTSFFIKPKPKLKDLPSQQRKCTSTDSIIFSNTEINLAGCNAFELYVNVINDGKTTVKRMRVRAKIHSLRDINNRSPVERPRGMNDEEWTSYKQQSDIIDKQIEEETRKHLFGRSLPFSKTPNGTVALPLIQVDNRETYEVDLAPKNDEASVRLAGIYHLLGASVPMMQKAGLNTVNYPQQYPIILHIGNVLMYLGNHSRIANSNITGLMFELIVKVWIVAENTTEDVSEIFHIEISNSLNRINCTKVKRYSREYRKFDKMLSV